MTHPGSAPRTWRGRTRIRLWPDACRRAHDVRGTAAIELVLVAPIFMLILLFVVGLGRMAHARQQIESVAADSARAASLERVSSRSTDAARTAAEQSLGDSGVSCTDLTVDVDLSHYEPGGRIDVTVTCRAVLSDVALAGFPGSRTFRAHSSVPIETYRAS